MNAADLRYIADACFDEGANIPEWRIDEYAAELENRIGAEPTEDQVIAYAVQDWRERMIDSAEYAMEDR